MTIKNYLKSITFYKSDFLLMFGFLFFIPFAAFSWKLMVTSNPDDVPFVTVPMIITCFLLSSLSWAIYLYLEAKSGRLKINLFFWLFLFYVIASFVSVIIQPTDSISFVECKNVNVLNKKLYPGIQLGDIITVYHHISLEHRLFFSMGSVLITTIFFIIFFVLPKRITDMNFLVLVCTIIGVFVLVITLYSYIFEGSQYVFFIKAVIEGEPNIRDRSRIASFLVNRVPYGACLMMGMLFMLVGHKLTRKKGFLFAFAYCYLNLIFTWNKTAIIISTFIVIVYVVFLLIRTFKSHKIRNVIFSIIFGVALTFSIIVVSVSIGTKGRFIYQIYNLSTTFTETKNLLFRTFIWGNIRNELSGGWLVIGRGFGTHNVLLYDMNLVNGDDVCPSHSTYYGILGAGGIVNLLGFAGMFAYFVFAFIKCWNVDKVKTIGLSFPVVAYFAYSFTECINYLWLVFMFPIILYYNLIKKERENQ